MTTYGLRPVDISRLSLDDLRWRQQEIALVQKKTGQALTLPLMPAVAEALLDYLQQDRLVRLPHRHVLVSLPWPHHPLRAQAIATLVAEATAAAGLSWVSARHLRATVATHLLRQGVAFSTIAEVLGHRRLESTERYATADVEMLRQVLEESER
jgi:site-specific recombinase XerD